jgi:hypothetical protein
LYTICFAAGGILGEWRMVRNPDKTEGASQTIFTGESQKCDPEKFIAGPVKKGIHNLLIFIVFVS